MLEIIKIIFPKIVEQVSKYISSPKILFLKKSTKRLYCGFHEN